MQIEIELGVLLTLIGLIFDLLGVTLLAVDLIRVQKTTAKLIAESESSLESFLYDYGELPDDISDLAEKTRRISLHEYWDHHAEDEASYNVDILFSKFKQLSENVSQVAEWSKVLVEFQKSQTSGKVV